MFYNFALPLMNNINGGYAVYFLFMYKPFNKYFFILPSKFLKLFFVCLGGYILTYSNFFLIGVDEIQTDKSRNYTGF